jgi:hypothetical protein
MDRPTFADEFLLAVAVAIGDARSRFAQDDAECDARAGYALFTNNLHAGNSGSGNTGNRFVFSRGKRNDYRGTERRYADIAIGRFWRAIYRDAETSSVELKSLSFIRR